MKVIIKIISMKFIMLVTIALLIFVIKNGSRQHNSLYAFLNNTQQDNFSNINTVTVYESITDKFMQIRDADKIAEIFAETKTDYVHRGFFRYAPEVDNYDLLKKIISKIKSKNPNIIFGASLIVSEVTPIERNPLTGESISKSEVIEMAFDPQKWNINYKHEGKFMTKEYMHRIYTERSGKDLYLPDITNAKYQRLVIDIIKKEIDSGADAIWIDGFYLQADLIADATGDVNHSAVKAAFLAYSKIVDEIHNYGILKGKRIYVGSWGETGRNPNIEVKYPYAMPELDFVTIGISPEEVKNKKIDKERWGRKISFAKKHFGGIPVIAVIDWAFGTDTALGVFSQNLTKDEANEALRNFDAFFNKNRILFAYPVHGGWMGWEAKKGSFGKSRIYDSLAPEFQTYKTIKQLAQKKNKGIMP